MNDKAAAWLLSEVNEQGVVYHETVVHDMQAMFGEDVVGTNDSGNLVISSEVLKAFRKMSPNVVWSRRDRYWRLREASDDPGRNQG